MTKETVSYGQTNISTEDSLNVSKPCLQLTIPSFLVTVEEERAKQATVQMVQHSRQKIIIELEGVWKLLCDLVD